MNLNSLLRNLKTAPAQAAIVFTSDAGDIGCGYHVTEFKLSRVTGIDCGGRVNEWQEAAVQLLDGNGGNHMAVSKFTGILEQSIVRVEGLGAAQVHVELSPNNMGLRIYNLQAPEIKGDRVLVRLQAAGAMCKPTLEAGLSCINPADNVDSDSTESGCCSPKPDSMPEPSRCCG